MAYDAAFPAEPSERRTKCKEDYDACKDAGGDVGSSIFSLNCTSLTEDMLLFVQHVLKDDYVNFQEAKKNERRLASKKRATLRIQGW